MANLIGQQAFYRDDCDYLTNDIVPHKVATITGFAVLWGQGIVWLDNGKLRRFTPMDDCTCDMCSLFE